MLHMCFIFDCEGNSSTAAFTFSPAGLCISMHLIGESNVTAKVETVAASSQDDLALFLVTFRHQQSSALQSCCSQYSTRTSHYYGWERPCYTFIGGNSIYLKKCKTWHILLQ